MSSNLVIIRQANQSLLNDILRARKNKALANELIRKKQKEIEAFNTGQISVFNKLKDRAAQRWQIELVDRFKNLVFNASTKYFYAHKSIIIGAKSVLTGDYELQNLAYNGYSNYTVGVQFYNPVRENGWLTQPDTDGGKQVGDFFLSQFKYGSKPFPDEVDELHISANFTLSALPANQVLGLSLLGIELNNGSVLLDTPFESVTALSMIKAQYPIYSNYLSDVLLITEDTSMKGGILSSKYKVTSGKYRYVAFLDPNKFDYAMTVYFLQNHISYSVTTYVPHNDFQEFLSTAIQVLSFFATFAAIIITAGAFLEFAAGITATTATVGTAGVSAAEATAAGMDSALIANTGFWANVQTFGFTTALESLGAETLGSYAALVYNTIGSFGLQAVGALSTLGSIYNAYSSVNRLVNIISNGVSGGSLPDSITTNINPQAHTSANADDSYNTLFESASEPDENDPDLIISRMLEIR